MLRMNEKRLPKMPFHTRMEGRRQTQGTSEIEMVRQETHVNTHYTWSELIREAADKDAYRHLVVKTTTPSARRRDAT